MIIGGLDVHRAQITFDCIDTDTGEVTRGQIRPATRPALRGWLEAHFQGRLDADLAVEGCTGWRFVVEELERAGVRPHLAEPADTSAARGRKKRAKTDRTDARLLRDLLIQERLPESWIPPSHVQEARLLARTYLALVAERRAWRQRVHAQLYHQGVAAIASLSTCEGRARLAAAELSPDARQAVDIALRMMAAIEGELAPLKTQLEQLSRRLPGARALDALFGIGPLTAVVIWAELGDCRRFRRSDQVVRLAGLDVTVWSSDGKRSAGHLARQGPPALRWALFEAAMTSTRETSPDHDYYQSVHERLSGKRAVLSVARKLARRCYHTLRELGDAALSPPEEPMAYAA